METVIQNNYKELLNKYAFASKYYQETGSADFLGFTLNQLERFERKFIEVYGFQQFILLRGALGVDETKLILQGAC